MHRSASILSLVIGLLLHAAVCGAAGTVRITVTDFHSGTPLPGVTVTMSPGGYSGRTGSAGGVSFDHVTPYRNYAVQAALPGYVEDRYGFGRTGFVRVVDRQVRTVRLALKQAAVIAGTVRSGGAPLAGAVVAIVEERADGPETVTFGLSEADGTYLIDAVPAGASIVRVLADGYRQADAALQVEAGAVYSRDFDLQPAQSSLRFDIMDTDLYYGNSVTLVPDNLLLMLRPRYTVPLAIPDGASLVKSSNTSFIPTGPGDYTFALLITDRQGVCRAAVKTFTARNHPTEAYPSVIPGPSELPLLDDGVVHAVSSGLTVVEPGAPVYLRGWGRDLNLPAPEQFNPAAPGFDIYGNKNGDWLQSAFSFSWQLRDTLGRDRTDLLQGARAQHASFTVPPDAVPGDTYTATLTVTGDADLAGPPADVTITVAAAVGTDSCRACHTDADRTWRASSHAGQEIGCEECHGPGSQHQGDPAGISVTHWPGLCGQCHEQFAQWQKSRHSDPLAFGHAEVAAPLMRECYKCHYTAGFSRPAESGDFAGYRYPMTTAVPVDTPNIGCDVCHDPHGQGDGNPTGIRTGSAATLCGTCHAEKWQNAVYLADADHIGNGYHWDDYRAYREAGNPHHLADGCVTCHMATDAAATDARGVRTVGGHTLRMRDAGDDRRLNTADDILNIGVCRDCHGQDLATFDRNGFMSAISAKLETLEQQLLQANHEFLPPFQPGKCATCHKGGTLPFSADSADTVLQKAYQNYSLVLHDRSRGIHNPAYTDRLLTDTIAAVAHLHDVTLAAFSVASRPGRAVLTWQTSRETDVRAFVIYRAARPEGPYRPLAGARVAAAGEPATYTVADPTAWTALRYWYKIADVSSDGTTTLHDLAREVRPWSWLWSRR